MIQNHAFYQNYETLIQTIYCDIFYLKNFNKLKSC